MGSRFINSAKAAGWAVVLGVSSAAVGDITPERPIHHFYNAHLLAPNELQVGITGSVRYGVSPELEIGTQGVLFLLGAYNFSLKHEMFDFGRTRTSFSSYAFSLPLPGSGRVTGLAYGVLTTADMSSNLAFTFGAMDHALRIDDDGQHFTVHAPGPTLGIDYTITRNLGLSLTGTFPVWLFGDAETDVGDISLSLPLWTGSVSELDIPMHVMFATGTLSVGSFNLEAGVLSTGSEPTPYANIFWRFN